MSSELYGIKVREAFETSETQATLLTELLDKHFGSEVFVWDPATIYLELRAEFKVEPASEVINRISAAQVVVTSDAFFNDIEAFSHICSTLSSGEPSFQLFDPVTTEEMAWGITEVSLIRDMLPFSYMVTQFIKHTLKVDGYNDSDYPEIFEYVLGEKVAKAETVVDIAERTLRDDQRDNVEDFINEQMRAVMHQFNEIPGMADDFLKKLQSEEELLV